MPDGVILRILISLALGTPSLLLWLVLRFIAKRWGISVAGVVTDWLKVVTFIILGLYVISAAVGKEMLVSGFGINFVGFLWVWSWAQRQSKPNDQTPTVLNISGRESVSTR